LPESVVAIRRPPDGVGFSPYRYYVLTRMAASEGRNSPFSESEETLPKKL